MQVNSIRPMPVSRKNASFGALTSLKMTKDFNPAQIKGCNEVYQTFSESPLIRKICEQYEQVAVVFSYKKKVRPLNTGFMDGKCLVEISCQNPKEHKSVTLGKTPEWMKWNIDNYSTFSHVKDQLNGGDEILNTLL